MVNHVTEMARRGLASAQAVVVLREKSNAPADYLERLPVEPIFLDLPADFRRPKTALAYFRGIEREVRKFRADIVHSYLRSADLFAALVARRHGLAHCAHILDRRGAAKSWNSRLTGFLLRRRKTRFPSVSQACTGHAIEVLGLNREHIALAYNGVDSGIFSSDGRRQFDKCAPLFGTIARMEEEKGQGWLLEAFARIAEQMSGARLVIAGGGPKLDEWRARAEAFGLGDRLLLPGRIDDAIAFLDSLDIFVIPSIDAEGLPTTILEAMGSGLPVVATDVGGAAEAVVHGRTGLVVPPRDVEALARAMGQLAENPEQAFAFGAAGRARQREIFNVAAMTSAIHDEVYLPLMRG